MQMLHSEAVCPAWKPGVAGSWQRRKRKKCFLCQFKLSSKPLLGQLRVPRLQLFVTFTQGPWKAFNSCLPLSPYFLSLVFFSFPLQLLLTTRVFLFLWYSQFWKTSNSNFALSKAGFSKASAARSCKDQTIELVGLSLVLSKGTGDKGQGKVAVSFSPNHSWRE